MSTPTLARALPAPAEIALAVEDSDYYADVLATLKTADRAWFAAEVLRQWKAQHPAEPQPEQPAPRPLDYVETRILDFANRRFHTPGEREQAIRDEFGYSATRYYQRLNALIDQPRALAYAPVTVNRLRRVREMRRQARSARQLTARSAAR